MNRLENVRRGRDVRRVVFDIFLSKYNLPLFPDFSNRLREKSLKN